MQRSSDNSPTIIREHWLAAVVRATQLLVLRSDTLEADEIRALLTHFIDGIPGAATHVEQLVLRGLLLDAAFHFGHAVHLCVHGGRFASCGLVPAAVVDQC